MTNRNEQKYPRRSIRLKGYDYSQAGAYFLTICTHQRKIWLKNNASRQIIQRIWNGLTDRYHQICLDEFIIMPNHVHGIIWIITHTDKSSRTVVGAIHESPLHNKRKPRSLLSKIVGYFKMNTAKEINMLRGTPGTPFWQRGYYERVIRAEK